MVANKHPQVSPHQFQTGFMTSDRKIDGFDGNRDSFMGIYNGYNEPEAVIRGRCSNTAGSSDSTIGVTQYNFTLDPEGSESINMILGVTDEEFNITALKDKYLTRMDEYFQKLQSSGRKFAAMNQVKTPDEHLNRMVNVWMKHQSSYGAKWCRWGWMGYRDIVQHGYGVSTFNPERTREILEEALKYQYQSGMALRGWNPVDTKAYSDSALWLVFAIISYMKETADFGFFEKKIGFYDGGFATVLEHIEKALDFLETNKGSHGLCLIKFGDWNDSLTAIGKEGKGESVWLSMAYAEAASLMAELYQYLNLHEKEKDFNRRYQDIKSAVNKHAWDGGWYIRCFDDNGRAVGSDHCDEGKIFVNTQSWAMISGVADEERTVSLLQSSKEKLLTKSGYLLLAPTFMKPDPHIGRISCLEPGICENGTVYSHANAWMVLGLLRANRADEAYEIFKRLTPGYFTSEDDVKHKSPPYIYANGYYGPAHRNNAFLSEFTWITGSVAWHYNNMVREMIGIKPEYGGLLIDPRLPSNWDQVEAQRIFRGKNFNIRIRRDGTGERSVVLNGEKMESAFIPLDVCQQDNRVEVTL
jgi:cellobiose phosphorylase